MPIEGRQRSNQRTGLEIAVIGMSGRFPGAMDLDEFWNNLANSVETIAFFTTEELKTNSILPINPEDPNYVKSRGIIEDWEYFDESFFNYTPMEAEMMDAQTRIFHEISWEALENAGYDPGTYEGLIGIYAGASPNFFWEGATMFSESAIKLGSMTVSTLRNKDFLSTLVSYKLNLTGPSYTLYTACSTSLVAIDQACRALLTAECDMALAGGVTNSYPSRRGYPYTEGMMFSKDGHCRTFDANASGTVFGNGAGVVVVKRLDEAIADGDHILVVIKGTGINNDGLSKVGYTAPSIEGQAAVIRAALEMAQVHPESITYVEAHGTGTLLGDPIEIEGLKLAFNTNKKRYCAIGSVKSNVGHLDCAAGAAGFIKTVLALQHRQIPPSLHFETPNPKIDFENSPFFVNTELREWTNGKYPLRAGVNSSGIGGTNAHAILEEAPKRESLPGEESRRWKILVFSAKTAAALDEITGNFANFLTRHPETNLADAAFTLQSGRRAFRHRRMVVCVDVRDTIDKLSSRDTDSQKIFTHLVKTENSPVVFMFPGQGSQYVNMGLELYQTESVFRGEMNRCFEILNPLMGYDIKEVLYPGDSVNRVSRGVFNINQTEIAQPVIFAIGFALARLLMTWGIKPDAMIGYSFGEYSAACISGVLSLEDAIELVVSRGRLMQKLAPGVMVSIPLPREEIIPLLNDQLSIAVDNGLSCIVSGNPEAIEALEARVKEKRLLCMRLDTSIAFHSTMMDPVLEPFGKKVKGITLNKPKIPYISNVTGKWILPGEAMNPGYWSKHIRAAVRFSDGLKELLKNQNSIFVEVGPGQVLSTLVRQHADKKPDHLVVNLIRHPKNNISDVYFLLNKIGRLWVWGKKIDWGAFHSSSQKRYRIPMPTYPFERQYYVIQENFLDKLAKVPGSKKLQRKEDIADWFYLPSWKRSQLPVNRGFDPMTQPCWLLFMDECGLGEGLLNRLEEEGLDVIIVKIGPGYKKVSSQVFSIDPQSPEDYESLLEELHSQNRVPQSIAHLWLFTEMENKLVELDPEKVEEVQNLGFYSMVYLVQAIGKKKLKNDFRVTVVSNNMQDVMGEKVLCPEKALVLGPVRVIPNEYTNITCRSIDLNIHNPHPGSWQKRKKKIVDQLFAEVTINDNDSYNTIAYRNDIRWIQIPEPIRWEMPEEKITCLRQGGVYLITGGLGGVGLVLAEHLVKTVNARLVLIGRTPLPRRENWQQWLDSHDEENSVNQKIRHILALEEQGGEVLVLSADVSNLEQMQGAIREAIEKFGRINGVIHAAGIPDAGLIQFRNKETSERVLFPKIRGSIFLDKVLKNVKPDFFILCSSVIAAVGNIGQVAYCAANNFLDAFSRYRTQRDNAYTVSIGWEGWKEVGMLANIVKKRTKPTSKKAVAPEEQVSILSSEGINVFTRILGSHLPHMVISTVDLADRIEARNVLRKVRLEKSPDKKKENSGPKRIRPDQQITYAAPTNEIEQKLAAILQEFLGIDKVGVNDDFFEMGGDSIIAIQIAARLQDEGLTVETQEFFINQTIRELAPYVKKSERSIDQGPIQGIVELSPIQKWFFEHNDLDMHHFNQSIMLLKKDGFQPALLEKVFKKITKHHDTLRMVFKFEKKCVRQYNRGIDQKAFDLKLVDLKNIKEQKEILQKIENEANHIQESMDLVNGPLVKLGLFKTTAGDHLLVSIHHLVIDAVSWRILLEDFIQGYQQAEQEKEIKFPNKTDSYKYWVEQLKEYSASSKALQELPYWQRIRESAPQPLPMDFELSDDKKKVKYYESLTMTLSERDTEKLLKEVNQAYNTEINDILLTSLGLAVKEWKGIQRILINLESHGREEIIKKMDISRTIGWFTTQFPVILDINVDPYRTDAGNRAGEDLAGNEVLGYTIKATKENLRKIPGKGIGYGILKYLTPGEKCEGLNFSTAHGINFNYLGQLSPQHVAENTSVENTPHVNITLSNLNMGSPISQEFYKNWLIDINGITTGNKLSLTFSYNRCAFKKDSMQKLVRTFKRELLRIIEHCTNKEKELTPSDLVDGVELSIEELKDIRDFINQNIEI